MWNSAWRYSDVTKERRLGRGLEALLGGNFDSAPEVASGGDEAAGLLRLSVQQIESNPFQPRRDFDEAEIESLAQSIREHGLLQPVTVRRTEQGYQLVAGERRYRAALRAGWSDVPAQVVEADDRQMAELAIVENLQRRDLNPLEKAESFRQYIDRYGCTQEELAGRLHIDRSTVANLIRLLDLPQGVQDAVRRGALTNGHARALLPLGDEHEQLACCQRIQDEGLSVRATEALVQERLQRGEPGLSLVTGEGESQPAAAMRSDQVRLLEQQFRQSLGTRVEIKESGKGRGRIVIHFNNHDEFERLHRQFCEGSGHGQHHHFG